MNFNKLINSLLGEELSDRERRIHTLRSARMIRSFVVKYYEYYRYSVPPAQTFHVEGTTLFDALRQLPVEVFRDIIEYWDEGLLDTFNNEEALIEYLNDIDIGGFSFIDVFENGEHYCGINGDWREDEEEIDFDDPDRQ